MKTSNKTLHLVSFDVPFPANYGGVIDVFYKIKELHKLGIKIILHCYQYGRSESDSLQDYCIEVNYYTRETNLKQNISRKPYIVKTRNSKRLIHRLKDDNYPILFEGLHTTYPLLMLNTLNRKIFIRTHNIEHNYYNGLKKSETNIFKKIFFQIESKKLKKYESILNQADRILTISPIEQEYFKNKYGDKAIYIPVFYDNLENKNTFSEERFSLWHGDLNVSDNRKSLEFIINVYKKLEQKLVIASSINSEHIKNLISSSKNITYKQFNTYSELEKLMQTAHINPIVSFQNTGIKLRLLNILSQGKHVIANSNIIHKTGLEDCVSKVDTTNEFRQKVIELSLKSFDQEDINFRKKYLSEFSPVKSAEMIVDLL